MQSQLNIHYRNTVLLSNIHLNNNKYILKKKPKQTENKFYLSLTVTFLTKTVYQKTKYSQGLNFLQNNSHIVLNYEYLLIDHQNLYICVGGGHLRKSKERF